MANERTIASMDKARSKFDVWWDDNPLPALLTVSVGFGIAIWAYYAHFSPGKSIGALAAVGGVMSLRPQMRFPEKAAWVLILASLAVFEFRAIDASDAENLKAKTELNNALREMKADLVTDSQQLNVVAMGISSMSASPQYSTKPRQAASAPTVNPTHLTSPQTGRRSISAEELGIDLKGAEHSSATVINDGTNEAGNFANQLVIGLMDAGWVAGGHNIKMGDPGFFPDALTVEVSSVPTSPDDHSVAAAKSLIAALAKQNIEATLRFTQQAFPSNFMRIKVAGQ